MTVKASEEGHSEVSQHARPAPPSHYGSIERRQSLPRKSPNYVRRPIQPVSGHHPENALAAIVGKHAVGIPWFATLRGKLGEKR
jgi:hypothetical protein